MAAGKKITVARRAVQLAMLALFCVPLLAAGWGLAGALGVGGAEAATPAEGLFYGTLSSSSAMGVTLLDPLAVAEMAAASRTVDPMWLVGVLPVVAVYGILRGRAFCGWVCPVNLLGEGVDRLRRLLKIPDAGFSLPRRAKVAVAVSVVVLSGALAIPAFELFSPIGAVSKGLAVGAFAGVATLLAVLACDLLGPRRLWCRSVCPLGGCYEVLGKVGQLNVAVDHSACIHCGRCEQACLCDPSILAPALEGRSPIIAAGDCMACGACIDACPVDALRFRLGRWGLGADAEGTRELETVPMTVENRT